MLRELTNRSRRKWVVGGALAFGSVALLSTGFATWVIGANRAYTDGELTVTVDTAENKSFVVTAVMDEAALKLAETAAVTNGILINNANSDGDLSITLTITVKTGTTGRLPAGVTFSLPTSDPDGTSWASGHSWGDNANVTVSSQSLTGDYARSGNSWTYIDVPVALENPGTGDAADKWTLADTSSGIETYTLTKTVSFTWGSFFKKGETVYSPTNFYNTVFVADASNPDKLLVDGGMAYDELTAMNTALTGKKLHLMVQVADVARPSSGNQQE